MSDASTSRTPSRRRPHPTSPRGRRGLALVAGVSVVGALVAMSSAAGAGAATPRAVPPHAKIDPWTQQRALEAAARSLAGVAAHDPGYGSTSVDTTTGTVVIARTRSADSSWRRAYEARYQATRTGAMHRTAAGRSIGATVRFRTTLFTARQETALFTLVSRQVPGLRRGGTHVGSWRPGVDGQPFEVHYTGRTPSRATVSAFQAYGAGTVRFVRDAGRVRSLTRAADTPPYYGGAVVHNNVPKSECSTGFGAKSPNTTYIITAGHCGNPADHRMFTGRGVLMGTITAGDRLTDTAFIHTSAKNRIFDGGLGSGEFTKLVVGNGGYYKGISVCTSGAVMKAVCGNRIVGPAAWESYNPFSRTYYESRGYFASNLDSKPTVANGDSGGPVFSIWKGGSSNEVLARGIVSAAPPNAQTKCPSSLNSKVYQCYNQFFSPDSGKVASDHNLTLTW